MYPIPTYERTSSEEDVFWASKGEVVRSPVSAHGQAKASSFFVQDEEQNMFGKMRR